MKLSRMLCWVGVHDWWERQHAINNLNRIAQVSKICTRCSKTVPTIVMEDDRWESIMREVEGQRVTASTKPK